MEFPQKTENRLSNPTPVNTSRQKHNSNRSMHPSVHCGAAYNSQDRETTEVFNRCKDKDAVHIHNRLLLSHKKERNSATCNNTEGPRDCHTK